ncbi:isochorismate synthase [Halobacillus sp. BAB-2008]|uniref:isochorismate synthase n=1 Tax=Halobacillus sp. BAB-2008 TaxID=1246484 RepID=UPI0002A504A8|nr:isochorismate synthase [Halobacillus sp. BAB-2008]ELK45962.1 menaquinone-specific isochorismate synthase [Halobacillus sp. BAB-2008]
MLHTKAPHIEEVIGEALQRAHHLGEPIFISFVEHIDDQEPYRFFEAGLTVDSHRSFWQSAEGDFTMVGIGKASQLFAEGNDRFKEVQSLWNDLKENAVVHDSFGEKGTGMVALGGFRFDPEEPEGKPWDNFKDSQLSIPSFLLTNVGGKSYLTSNALLFPEDHAQQIAAQIADQKDQLLNGLPGTYKVPEIETAVEVAPHEWKETIRRATEDIKAGLLEKIVLARELRLSFKEDVSVSSVLRALAESQPNSYIFAFESEGDYFVGATPERLVKVDERRLVSTCLAGTIPRGATPEADLALGEELLNDPKNRQEHQFVVEMIRQAVEACSSDVQIPEAPVLYPLRNLQHLYTPVNAILDEGYTLLNVVEKLHPTPALGGMPQKESVAYIREKETLNRGWYAGPVGWFDAMDNGEFAVAIRSALIQKRMASLFAGCGVVADSDPQAEYEETAVKLKPMLSVLGGS